MKKKIIKRRTKPLSIILILVLTLLNVQQTVSAETTKDVSDPLSQYFSNKTINLLGNYSANMRFKESPLGNGWLFPFDYYIQMYAKFDVAEYRPDGSFADYFFKEDNTSWKYTIGFTFDGDDLITYPLDQGHYESAKYHNNTLRRISKNEYHVTYPNGAVYIYKGYKAPWRKGENPIQGKLIEVINKDGTQIRLNYDKNGRLVEVKLPNGRNLEFTYIGKLISTMVDSKGQTLHFNYIDGTSLLHQVSNSQGGKSYFTYDSQSRLASIVDSKTGKKEFYYLEDLISLIVQKITVPFTYNFVIGRGNYGFVHAFINTIMLHAEFSTKQLMI